MSRFWAKVTLFALPFAAFFGFPLLILFRGGELAHVNLVVARQQQPDPLLYGPAYTNPSKRYKVRAAQVRRPEILSLGSSRVMEFRASFFREAGLFYNTGGAVSTVWDARHFLRRLFRDSQPQIIILGLDQWFFNPNWVGGQDVGSREMDVEDSSLNTIQRNWRAVYQDIGSGKIGVGRVMIGGPAIGLNAIMRDNGFRNDGSYYYGDCIRDPATCNHWDRGFQDTLARIRNGVSRFEWSDTLDLAAIDEVQRFLNDAATRKIKVAAFLPPFAPLILARMRASGHYRYLDLIEPALRPLFAGPNAVLLDLTDPAAMGATDDEFIDGVHGSEKTYLRILLQLASADKMLEGEIPRQFLQQRLGQASQYEIPEAP
jgi:hypothetical protein